MDAIEQRYTRLGDNRYPDKGLSTWFVAELAVDRDGIIGDCPGVFLMAQAVGKTEIRQLKPCPEPLRPID